MQLPICRPRRYQCQGRSIGSSSSLGIYLLFPLFLLSSSASASAKVRVFGFSVVLDGFMGFNFKLWFNFGRFWFRAPVGHCRFQVAIVVSTFVPCFLFLNKVFQGFIAPRSSPLTGIALLRWQRCCQLTGLSSRGFLGLWAVTLSNVKSQSSTTSFTYLGSPGNSSPLHYQK